VISDQGSLNRSVLTSNDYTIQKENDMDSKLNVNYLESINHANAKSKDEALVNLETDASIELSIDEARGLGLFSHNNEEMDYDISRTLFFDGEITEASATQLRAELMTLAGEDRQAPIRLMLGTPGGGLYESLAIYDTIKMIPNEVIAICSGKVMSGGIIILLACDKRLSTPNTTFMIHHGHTTMDGNITELREQLNEITMLNEKMLSIIINKTKLTRSKLEKYLCRDYYLNADEADKIQLVQRIVTNLDQV
jgi:ATP-dependent Clp protease protease subunit